jgi:hypothetical protein
VPRWSSQSTAKATVSARAIDWHDTRRATVSHAAPPPALHYRPRRR